MMVKIFTPLHPESPSSQSRDEWHIKIKSSRKHRPVTKKVCNGTYLLRQGVTGFTKSVIFAIDFYHNYISCLMLPRCRFSPTCSAYARQAVEKKGLVRGLFLSLRRLLRCHPFSQAPVDDPVE